MRVRNFGLMSISTYVPDARFPFSVENRISILAAIDCNSDPEEQMQGNFVTSRMHRKHGFLSSAAQMKEAEKAWLTVIRGSLSKTQRKQVLGILSRVIAPWFFRMELLMDFLIDSVNLGGSTSLMGLSGLFYLIQEKNLDYPQFYLKLYSQLDRYALHSKHRSRFFRLLRTFLDSTHLPAALIASFVKRLGRLCLHSPPSGIVAIVPWIYNLLKGHPTCSFMVHRITRSDNLKVHTNIVETQDLFQVKESDPMKTCALGSSLWEIETLQAHYNPNVAAIAKIISEQFSKHAYNTEDFLDHSYGSVCSSERTQEHRLMNI